MQIRLILNVLVIALLSLFSYKFFNNYVVCKTSNQELFLQNKELQENINELTNKIQEIQEENKKTIVFYEKQIKQIKYNFYRKKKLTNKSLIQVFSTLKKQEKNNESK